MTRTPAERWPSAEFDRLRLLGDPDVDAAVAGYLRDHHDLGDARAMVRSVIQDLARAKANARTGSLPNAEPGAPSILDELGSSTRPPAWATDKALIEQGQNVFYDTGLYQVAALFCASLPLAYAEPSSARVLAGVSDLATQNLTRRVAETGQMLIDVMGLRDEKCLGPGSAGHTTAIGLRILHASVRALVRERQKGWDDAEHGAPVNQELLLATLVDFSAVSWHAMRRLGVELTEDEKRANLYTWSVFGHLMGVTECRDEPLTLADTEPIMDHFGAMLAPSEAGRRLMAALLAEMESFMGLGWRKLPRSLVRWVFQDWHNGMERVPGLLDVPKAAWWSGPLFSAVRLVRRHRWPDPFGAVVRLLTRRAARYMIIGFAEFFSAGSAPFQIPPELAKSWRIRQSPPGRVRRLRYAVRRRVRARTRMGPASAAR